MAGTAGQTGKQLGHSDTDDQNQGWKPNQGNTNLLKAAVTRRIARVGQPKATNVGTGPKTPYLTHLRPKI